MALRRSRLVLALLLAGPAALAKGRPAQTISVAFQPGDARKIWVGTTLGLLYSPDDGATWSWICEPVLGYTGFYDPIFAVSASGTIFETMSDGLRVSRDGGCDFSLAGPPLDGSRIGDVRVGGDGAVWAATQGTARDNDVFVSHDDGMLFQSTGLARPGVFFGSLRVAPSDPARVYAAGYEQIVDGTTRTRQPLLLRTDDGAGTPWVELPSSPESTVELTLLGVSRGDPDVVFARLNLESDVVYRSQDAGLSWTPVVTFEGGNATAFVSSPDGQVIVIGAGPAGVRISHDAGVTFEDLAGAPQMGCAGTREADEVIFACGTNWDPDQKAIGRSTDLASWTKVFRFSELGAQLECPEGSDVAGQCTPLWCSQCRALGCPDPACRPPPDAGPPPPLPDSGCACRLAGARRASGDGGRAALVLLAYVLGGRRSRRRCRLRR